MGVRLKMNGGLFMQKLKQELKDKIILEAKNAFLEKGFDKASMREIAKASGITVGNIYRYFKNKDELFFAVVEDAHNAITNIIGSDHSMNMNHMNDNFIVSESDFKEYVDPALNKIIDVFVSYKDEVTILVYKSQGSKLGMMIDEFKKVIVEKIYVQVLDGQDGSLLDLRGLAEVLAYASIEGITRVCRSDASGEEIYRNIYSQMMFLFMGAKSRLQYIEQRLEGELDE